jgi:hypothetical protein
VAGGDRSALPSASAGVGPYLDPAPRCGVFSLVEGLIVPLWVFEDGEGIGGTIQPVKT